MIQIRTKGVARDRKRDENYYKTKKHLQNLQSPTSLAVKNQRTMIAWRYVFQ